jgi:hypothetical protein
VSYVMNVLVAGYGAIHVPVALLKLANSRVHVQIFLISILTSNFSF